ncbi:MAG: SusC/RagA family TonB-linked outer membrane protein, partial [Saprospiraceae bacterium]
MKQRIFGRKGRNYTFLCGIRLLFSTFFLFLFAISALAQRVTVTGTVISSEDQQPLIGVSVAEKDTANGVSTDVDGRFRLEVAEDAILTFSYTGFENQEVPVQGRTTIAVTLQVSTQMLEDVVVTGYRKEIRTDVASAISSIKAKDIKRLVVSGIDQALQGQAPGLQVTQVSGAPGDDIAVRIRGAGTLGNNNPLFIVDGVPTTGNINMFSTNDIETIEVLKDGAAAAIYGARAANGVIVITTKKGKAGKPQFEFEASAGFSEANRLPKLLNTRDYLTIRNEAITNANVLRDPNRQLETYDPAILDTLADVDWLDLVFNKAPVQRYSLSASGGGEGSSYYIQGEYQNQEGVFRGQGFEKYGLRFNGEAGNKRFKIGNNLSFAYTNRKIIGSTGDGFGPGNEPSGIRYALIAAPVFKPYNADGSYVNVSSLLGDPMLYGDGNANPLAIIDATDWTIRNYRIFGSVFAELTILDGLKLRTTLGGDLLFQNEKRFKQRLSAAIYSPTSLTEARVFDQNLIWNNILDFQHSFHKHRVSGLLGMEAIQNQTSYLAGSANNFSRTDPLFRYLDNSVALDIQNVSAGGIVTEWALLSYFAQASYTYDNRYVLSASVRRDGSSRFGRNNRYGVFPGASVAWNVSNERFFEKVKFVSALKLRASWGILGNQDIGIYPFSSLVGTGQHVYSFGGQIATGAKVLESGNSKVKWESCEQIDFGLDLSVWNDRLSFIGDYYRKRTSDILVQVPVPEVGGEQHAPYVNAGEVENTGLELGLIFKNRSGAFNYSLGGNVSTV